MPDFDQSLDAPFDFGFDANEYDAAEDFVPIPDGDYLVQLIRHEWKVNKKDPRGSHMEVEFEVLDEGFKGRRLWDRLNLKHTSADAVSFAKQKLAWICHGAHQPHAQTMRPLYGVPLIARVTVRPERTENGVTYRASNDIQRYFADDDAEMLGEGELPIEDTFQPEAKPEAQPEARRAPPPPPPRPAGGASRTGPQQGQAQARPGSEPWKRRAR